MLAARRSTGWYGFIFTAVVFMKSIFYLTISYSSGVEQELYFREWDIDETFSHAEGFDFFFFFVMTSSEIHKYIYS